MLLYALESLHRVDSNEYNNIPFSIRKKKKFTLNWPKSAAREFFSKGLKNEFEIAVVNEQSGFEPLKVYCMSKVRGIIALSFRRSIYSYVSI